MTKSRNSATAPLATPNGEWRKSCRNWTHPLSRPEIKRTSDAIQLWEQGDKNVPWFPQGENRMELVPFDGYGYNFYVEWTTMDPAVTECTLEIYATTFAGSVKLDSIKFRPFNSVVIAYVGENQEARDDNGTNQIVERLRSLGYDAYIFDEDDLAFDLPFHYEVQQAHDVVLGYDPGRERLGEGKSLRSCLRMVFPQGSGVR